MEDFDIQISMNGMENELSDFTGISKASTISPIRSISSVSAKPLVAVDVKRIEPKQRQQVPKYFSVSRFEGEPTTDNEPKKSWVDTLKYTLASAGIGTSIAALTESENQDYLEEK